MSDAIRELLATYRDGAKTEREKGTYFERLCVEFLKNDPEMAHQYEDAWTYTDWADERGIEDRFKAHHDHALHAAHHVLPPSFAATAAP